MAFALGFSLFLCFFYRTCRVRFHQKKHVIVLTERQKKPFKISSPKWPLGRRINDDNQNNILTLIGVVAEIRCSHRDSLRPFWFWKSMVIGNPLVFFVFSVVLGLDKRRKQNENQSALRKQFSNSRGKCR